MAWVLDLDGVVWRGDRVLPGAAEAVARLRAAGERTLFVTNNSSSRRGDQEAKLAGFGIPAEGEVVTSAMAAATLVHEGDRVLVTGGPGVVEAVAARGAEAVPNTGRDVGAVDVVVVGFHRDFDYERLRVATAAVRGGARFLSTNDDPTFPTPEGVIPGGGSLAAAVAYAAEQAPEVAGKPHPPMASLVRDLVGAEGTMVGDRPDTDGRFAVTLGYRFALVLSGVTRREDLPVLPSPQLIADDLARAVGAAGIR